MSSFSYKGSLTMTMNRYELLGQETIQNEPDPT